MNCEYVDGPKDGATVFIEGATLGMRHGIMMQHSATDHPFTMPGGNPIAASPCVVALYEVASLKGDVGRLEFRGYRKDEA